MAINLSPELSAAIQKRVDSGQYESATDVIRTALQLLMERDQRLASRESIHAGPEGSEHAGIREASPAYLKPSPGDAGRELQTDGPFVSDLHDETLRIMNQREMLQKLRSDIYAADIEIERGDYFTLTPYSWAELIAEAQRETEAGLPLDDDLRP